MASKSEAKPSSSRGRNKDVLNLYQPSPRASHCAVAVVDQVFLGLGITEQFTEKKRKELSHQIEIHDPFSEIWNQKKTTGTPPSGLVSVACTSIDTKLYTYGGNNGGDSPPSGTLCQLDVTKMEWKHLTSDVGPMRKKGAGMIAFSGDKLALFGGLAIGIESVQQGSSFKPSSKTNGIGLTNEFHIFDINYTTWSSPPMTGTRPPPCTSFTLTSVDEHRGVLFGGYQAECGPVNDVFILELNTMHWSKVGQVPGEPWPVKRAGHAACCIGYGGQHPHVLISGGMYNNEQSLGDTWLFNLASRKWKKLTLRDDVKSTRVYHSTTAVTLGAGLVEVIMFGGSPDITSAKSPQKISETTILGFEFDVFASDWMLMDVATNSQRAKSKRLRDKMAAIAAKTKEMVSIQEHVLSSRHIAESTSLRETIKVLEERVRESEAQTEVLRAQLQDSLSTVQSLFRTVEDSEHTRRKCEDDLTEARERLQEMTRLLEQANERARNTERRASFRQASNTDHKEPDWILQREEIMFTEHELGRGGWGVVKVATFRGIKVTAKQLFREISPFYHPLFIREMNMAAHIRHPNLIQFIGATFDNEPIILTELMSTSLRAVLERGPITHFQIISISLDVARALNYLHLMKPDPIIHRDVSSANVLLNPSSDDNWKAKVSDYGSVNLLRELQTVGPGSPVYAAPEAKEPGLQSPKMDIYSFGILQIEMGTHTFPEVTCREGLIHSIEYPHLVELIRRCIDQEKNSRPCAADIVVELNEHASVKPCNVDICI